MGHENENNRSTAMTPEIIATINASVATGVKDAISGLFAELAPLLRDLNKPYVDPVVEARALREKMKFKQEEIEGEKAKRLMRDNCSHRYPKNGKAAVAVVRNFPDKNPRGVCMLCQDWLHPREWRIDPTPEHPEGAPHIVPAHPKYSMVHEVIALQEA